MVFKTGAKRLKKLHQKISKKIKIKNSLKKKKEIRKEFANRLVLETHQNVTNEKKKKKREILGSCEYVAGVKSNGVDGGRMGSHLSDGFPRFCRPKTKHSAPTSGHDDTAVRQVSQSADPVAVYVAQ